MAFSVIFGSFFRVFSTKFDTKFGDMKKQIY
jgi:hypothetical protein